MRQVKKYARVGESTMEFFRWREEMEASPSSPSFDNPDRSCPLRSRCLREGEKVEDIDGEEETVEEVEESWLAG